MMRNKWEETLVNGFDKAAEMVSDPSIFTEDQIKLLQVMIYVLAEAVVRAEREQ